MTEKYFVSNDKESSTSSGKNLFKIPTQKLRTWAQISMIIVDVP